MTDSESEETSADPQPRIPLKAAIGADMSYVDLFDSFAREANLKLREDREEDHTRRFPNVVQGMLARLEMYGRLANLSDITQRPKGCSRKRTKTEDDDLSSSDADDRFYDLSDTFLEAECDEADREDEAAFESAVSEGHFAMRPEDFARFEETQRRVSQKSSSVKSWNRKKRAKDIAAYPDTIQKTLRTLSDLYERSRDDAQTVAYPRGAMRLINDALSLMLCDPAVDRADICLTLSEICRQPLESIEKRAEKQLAMNEKNRVATAHTQNLKKLKALIVAENRNLVPTWSPELKTAFQAAVESLAALTDTMNKFNAVFMKSRPMLEIAEEERKLENDVGEWSSGRFLLENREVQVSVIGQSCSTPCSLIDFVLRPRLVVDLELPRKSREFAAMPAYDPSDFCESPAVIDLR